MIFKSHHLLGIKSGKITLAFRRWEKPRVKAGGTIRNEFGVIRIDSVAPVDIDSITGRDAKNAGFDDREELIDILNTVEKGRVYKIGLAYQSADPRINLRAQVSLGEEEFQKLKKKLDRLEWAMTYLRLIKKYPERRAGDLADMLQMDKLDFKLRVRKLKNLGLTISHEVGYSVSPLGEWVMKKAS